MLKVYNSLTKKKEEFKPQIAGKVMMYVCGPTVYNDIHIGNARSMVAFDTIRRYLEYSGYDIDYVSNFTDVDDKIIKQAQKLAKTPVEIAKMYIASVKEDMKSLNIKEATKNPKATDYIDQMVDMIKGLIDKDYAYVAENGDVYFRTRAFEGYGSLSHQNLDELENGASKRLDDEIKYKEDPLDFVLWKHAKGGEISWQTKIGDGRPGWHIECSAMVENIFGRTIDIHGGGQDLTFPHHENERAQSEALMGKTFAKYWLHNGYVTVGNHEKMSKSKGNFTTVKKLLEKVPADVVRFFMASAHYRKPLQFDETTLDEAKNNLNKIKEAYDYLVFRLREGVSGSDIAGENYLAEYKQKFKKAMDDDFNTANALTVVYDFVKWINEYSRTSEVKIEILEKSKILLAELMNIFGINLDVDNIEDEDWILDLINKRNQARKNKDYALSDKIRDELKEKGIILMDTAQGTNYKRIDK